MQKRERIHPDIILGTGKIEELKAMLSAYDATGIVCDDELSPAQLRNLEQMLGTKVMDRTNCVWIFLQQEPYLAKGRFRWSWHS